MYQNSLKIGPVNLQTQQPEPIQTKKTQINNSYSVLFAQTDISGIITDASESKQTLIAPKLLTMNINWNILENCFSQQKKYNSDIYDAYLLIYQRSAKAALYKSTDGDRFLSNNHKLFYQNFVDRRSGDFLKLMNEIYTILNNHVEQTIPIGYPLNLWKCIRSRFQMK